MSGGARTRSGPPEGGTALLEGALVVTLDDRGTTGELSLAVRGGAITAIGEEAELRRRYRRARRVDCQGRLLLPGLINAHLHPELHILKGALEELSLHDWSDARLLQAALAYLSSDEGRTAQRAGVLASLAESLLGGTTCIGTYGVSDGADAACAAALRGLGLRGHITIRDASFAPVPRSPAPHMYRLHAEEALNEAELRAAAAAHARGERIVMHAAETEYRVGLARDLLGMTTIRLLEHWGLLSERVLLSHAVHVDEEEATLIARSGAPVIASPSAEMKLADGLGPFAEYHELGVPLALGTDAAVCNNSNDMFLEMRQLGLSQKLRRGADTLPAEQILRTATRGSARALGEAERLGSIEAGKAADLILLDLASPRLQPLIHRAGHTNIAANLVYAATGQDVTDVMVAGRWRVRERHLLAADADRIWEDLADAANTLFDHLL